MTPVFGTVVQMRFAPVKQRQGDAVPTPSPAFFDLYAIPTWLGPPSCLLQRFST